jgi:hypothetical protein
MWDGEVSNFQSQILGIMKSGNTKENFTNVQFTNKTLEF